MLVANPGVTHQIVIRYYGRLKHIAVSCTCLRVGGSCTPLESAVRLPARDAIAAWRAHLARLAAHDEGDDHDEHRMGCQEGHRGSPALRAPADRADHGG